MPTVRIAAARASVENCSRAGFPQVFDNYAVTVMIGEDPYTLGLFDTAGASAYIYHFNFAPNRACLSFRPGGL